MISELNKSDLKTEIKSAFQNCRALTLELFKDINEDTFCNQAHPDFSPVGWHLGHIGYTESLWILERTANQPCLFPQYRKLFAADGLPKSERVKLPNYSEICDFLTFIRSKVLDYLEIADIEKEERLWRFLLQHESQHSETVALVLELVNSQQSKISLTPHPPSPIPYSPFPVPSNQMIEIPAGEFEMGSNAVDALDNERPVHQVYLDTYYIDRYPVTCGQYLEFMLAGGYENAQWWSESGWAWLQTEQIKQPLYWQNDSAWDNHPVCGVSWYEAEAYAKFVGKRLPTEAEWEKAASWDEKAKSRRLYPWGNEKITTQYCNHNHQIKKTTPVNAYPSGQSAYGLFDTLGNVWEWTNSWFDGYKGFQYYPYVGYSQTYFDNQHRVLKGGSWTTRQWALRCSFRNWYHPSVRQIFAGFRCAKS